MRRPVRALVWGLGAAALVAAGAVPATAAQEAPGAPESSWQATDAPRERLDARPAAPTGAGAEGLAEAGVIAPPGRFVPIQPLRIIDTRERDGKIGAGKEFWYDFSDAPADAVALVFNVTVTGSTARTTFVSALDASAPDGVPETSTLNVPRGKDVANLVTIPLLAEPETGDRILGFYNNAGEAHIIGDLFGYYSSDEGSGFIPVSPTRVFDGRTDGAHIAGQSRRIALPGAPANATGVAVTITSTQSSARTSYVGAWPTGGTPGTSVLNAYAGQDIANLAVVPLGTGGTIDLYNDQGVNFLIVDVVGWYVETGGAAFHPMAADRAVGSGRLGEKATRTFTSASAGIAVPSTAKAVAVNLTTAGATRPTYLTLFPTGTTRPLASSANARVGTDVATAAFSAYGPGFNLYNNAGSVIALVDVQGYFE